MPSRLPSDLCFVGLVGWWFLLVGCSHKAHAPEPAALVAPATPSRHVELVLLCDRLAAEATLDEATAVMGGFGPEANVLLIVGYGDVVYGKTYLTGRTGRAEVAWVIESLVKARPGWRVVVRTYAPPTTA